MTGSPRRQGVGKTAGRCARAHGSLVTGRAPRLAGAGRAV